MKVFIVTSLLSALLIAGGCSKMPANNNTGVTTNVNSSSDANSNSNKNSNTNVAVATPETVPDFSDAESALAAGKEYLDKDKAKLAVIALKQAVKLNPDTAESWFQLGIALGLVEKTEPTPEETPTPAPEVKSKKSKITGQGEYVPRTDSEKAFAKAAAAYEKIVKKNTKDDVAFFNLGRSYNKINKDKEAEKALGQAVKLKPDDSEYQMELGSILIKLAKYDEALTALKKAQKLDEGNGRIEDLLQKADAGQKRTEYANKDKKPPENQKQQTYTPPIARPKTQRTPTANANVPATKTTPAASSANKP
jgi:tetratricopeptide (TPR) repeat protein